MRETLTVPKDMAMLREDTSKSDFIFSDKEIESIIFTVCTDYHYVTFFTSTPRSFVRFICVSIVFNCDYNIPRTI